MKLEEINEKYSFMKDVCFEINEGWAEIVDRLCTCLDYIFKKEGTDYGFTIYQIKQKYARLTIYYGFTEEIPEKLEKVVRIMVQDAEAISRNICEFCGGYGELKDSGGWVYIACDACEKKLDER